LGQVAVCCTRRWLHGVVLRFSGQPKISDVKFQTLSVNNEMNSELNYSVMLSGRVSKWATRKKKDQEPRFKIQDSRFKNLIYPTCAIV
jgi:hypothetical protein